VSNLPATNLPLGSVESRRVYRMVKESALEVKNRGADLMGASGWRHVQPDQADLFVDWVAA